MQQMRNPAVMNLKTNLFPSGPHNMKTPVFVMCQEPSLFAFPISLEICFCFSGRKEGAGACFKVLWSELFVGGDIPYSVLELS